MLNDRSFSTVIRTASCPIGRSPTLPSDRSFDKPTPEIALDRMRRLRDRQRGFQGRIPAQGSLSRPHSQLQVSLSGGTCPLSDCLGPARVGAIYTGCTPRSESRESPELALYRSHRTCGASSHRTTCSLDPDGFAPREGGSRSDPAGRRARGRSQERSKCVLAPHVADIRQYPS